MEENASKDVEQVFAVLKAKKSRYWLPKLGRKSGCFCMQSRDPPSTPERSVPHFKQGHFLPAYPSCISCRAFFLVNATRYAKKQ